jgi:hypothetical protein
VEDPKEIISTTIKSFISLITKRQE